MTTNVIDIEAWLGRQAKPDEPPDEEPACELDADRAVYTVRRVAWLLSMSQGTVYELLRAGEIPATRLGSRWIIPRARFHAWLDSLVREPQQDGGAV